MSAAAVEAKGSASDDPHPGDLLEVIVKEEIDFEAVEVLNHLAFSPKAYG